MNGDAGKPMITTAGPDDPGGVLPHPSALRRWYGHGLAIALSAEVVALMVHALDVGRLLVTAVVVAASTTAFRVLTPSRIERPTYGRSLVVPTTILQAAVIAGWAIGLTWWLALVPGLLSALMMRPLDPGRRGRRWVRPLAVTVAAATIVGVGPAFSLGSTLVRPSTDPASLRAVEWLRLRGGQGLVNGIEHWWYSHHAPPTGGAPDIPLSIEAAAPNTPTPNTPTPNTPTPNTASANTVAVNTAGTRTLAVSPAPAVVGSASAADRAVRTTPITSPPPAVRPLVNDPLPGEGQWVLSSDLHGHPSIWVTRMRPDPVHTSVVVALARMDLGAVRLKLVAGTEDPGGTWPEHGQVPAGDRPHLLAVFNSGFRQREAGGGYWSDGRQAAPLLTGGASLVIRKDGTATVGVWGRDVTMGPEIAAVRQNLQLIVDAGAPVPGLDQSDNRAWGRTVGHKVLVWRSGLGVTKSGALVYAGGPGLSIRTLADVLSAAGSVRAMELDINSAWVAYFLFRPGASGPVGTKLLPGMRHAPTRYLSPQSRDFVEVLAR